MIIYRYIRTLFVISLIVSLYGYAQELPQPTQKAVHKIKKKKKEVAVIPNPPLGLQLKKTPLERVDNQVSGILNDIKFEEPDVDDWEENTANKGPSAGITRDVSQMGSGIKDLMQKHNFMWGDHPYSLQGLPILYTSKSTGFNIGTRLSFADLKTEDPYTFLFTFQFQQTDRGAKNDEVSLDIPSFFSRHWRIKLTYTYPEVIDNNYFGIGNSTIYDKDLVTPGNPNFLSRTYYQYIFTYPRFTFDIFYKFLRETMSIYAGIGFARASIDPYNKDQSSKIFTEQPYGYSGGNTNYIKIGLKYDSRDYPLNPTKGIVLAGTYTDHAKFIASDFSYKNADFTYMGFFSFFKYFVLGHRVMVDQIFGNDVPFFALAEFNSYDNYDGLGGQDTLRGAPTFRLIDNMKFVNQIELRTRFYNGFVFGQHMELSLVPFWDFGRVWDRHQRFTFDGFHNTFGNTFKFTWNTTFIASFTMGFSNENFSTYLTFGESFD